MLQCLMAIFLATIFIREVIETLKSIIIKVIKNSRGQVQCWNLAAKNIIVCNTINRILQVCFNFIIPCSRLLTFIVYHYKTTIYSVPPTAWEDVLQKLIVVKQEKIFVMCTALTLAVIRTIQH